MLARDNRVFADVARQDARLFPIDRDLLDKGRPFPEWFSFPEVEQILASAYRPRADQGFPVFFTGLSGSGKSVIGNALMQALRAKSNRPLTMLDGDVVRRNLSSELGFSKAGKPLFVETDPVLVLLLLYHSL